MAERAFRFSVGIHSAKSLNALQDKAKRLEDIGFDVLHLPTSARRHRFPS
jgi:hypothetical protein